MEGKEGREEVKEGRENFPKNLVDDAIARYFFSP
jgi:hypothetical protein